MAPTSSGSCPRRPSQRAAGGWLGARRAGRQAGRLAVVLAVVVLLPWGVSRAGEPGAVLASRELSPSMRAALARARTVAIERVRSVPSCGALFAALDADGETCLAQTFYLAVRGHGEDRLCRSGVPAYTTLGSAVTRVCPSFARLDDEGAAMILIHEALHRAGLDERPHDPDGLTPEGINRMVGAGCGLAAARRAAAVAVARHESEPPAASVPAAGRATAR